MTTTPLTPIQLEVLRAFFATKRGFFLTGGVALAGFFLRHRAADHLDLLTPGRCWRRS